MNSNETNGVQASDRTSSVVESLLQQMALRGPSDQLDDAIACLTATDETKEAPLADGVRFGWPVVLSTAVAAMLAGVWLGSIFLPVSGEFSNSRLAAGDSNGLGSKQLTSVSFNMQAFNLLHGHSQKAEFENCGQCHRQASVEDDTLSEVFGGWFYGNEQFFEAHLDGIDDCSECHTAATERAELAKDSAGDFARLVRCSDCHQVDADGFGGFKTDWRYEGNKSKG